MDNHELLTMLQPDYDQENHWDKHHESVEDIFAQAITLTDPVESDLVECGSYKPSDTCKCLYRILYLCKPKAVDFHDMYKPNLFAFYSADHRFGVAVNLYKYELALYFYASKNDVDMSGVSAVFGGWPGADNGQMLISGDGKLFFEIVKLAIEREWCVYSGNNFEV